MSTTLSSPKRIADYFFMVGLRDETSLMEAEDPLEPSVGQAGQTEERPLASSGSPWSTPIELDPSTQPGGDTGQPILDRAHEQAPLTRPTATTSAPFSAPSLVFSPAAPMDPTQDMTTSTPLSLPDQGSIKSPNRTRSKSMAHFQDQSTQDQVMPHRVLESGTLTMRPEEAPRTRRQSTASLKGMPRRSVTMSDIGAPSGSHSGSGSHLQHKPSYRHVSAGTLFKTMQEGIQREMSKDVIQEDEEAPQGRRVSIEHVQAGLAAPKRHDTYPKTVTHDKSSTLSIHDIKSMALGKNAVIRSRSKIVHETAKVDPSVSGEIYPGDRTFAPIVTCRYPETDWEDSEAFPAFLPMFCFPAELAFRIQEEQPSTTYHSFVMTQETGNRSYAMCVTMYERLPVSMHKQFDTICQKWTHSHMSESEMEYAKAIKTKISRERNLMRGLQEQLRESRTQGQKARQIQLKRDIVDCEEKLFLLEDQMKPWRGLFVEIEDVWMPRCVGLVSAIPYHYLLRDWLLAVVVACSGGVDHPGMSLSSLRLERYVKNIIHDVNLPPFGKLEVGISINNRVIYASRPALNSVPIVKNFSLFPLFRCLSAEDIVTIIEVILSEGKVIFLSSHLGMLTLASESFLYLLFPLYWQGVYIPILPAALMTCLQAPVPYIIGVERRSRDPDFPPEDACVVDLDKGLIEVQLPPIQLPPRPRRKLVQSLEQYAPTSAIRRSPAIHNSSLGPPAYVKKAFPHSRLTLFCGVSRAPRWAKRHDSMKPPSTTDLNAPPPQSAGAAGGGRVNPAGQGSPSMSRKPSNNHLALAIGPHVDGGRRNGASSTLGPNLLPKIPKVEFEKEALIEGGLICPDFPEREQTSIPSEAERQGQLTGPHHSVGGPSHVPAGRTLPGTLNTESKDVKTNRVSPETSTSESFKTATRKVLSPTRTRANVFELPKKTDLPTNPTLQSAQGGQAMMQPGVNRSNSSQSTHLNTSGGFDGVGRMGHRASFASIESSSSSLFTKSPMTTLAPSGSPISTITSNTMSSINGPSLTTTGLPMGGPLSEEEKLAGILAPIVREGHVLSSVSNPVPISFLSCRCGICSHSIATHHEVYRCEGCSLLVHAGCMEELLYPCVPRGFDESGICWSVLQMWAGLMKGYRSGMIAGQTVMQSAQHQSPRSATYGHTKQLSSSGSEGEKEGRDRLSWASFQRWTGRGGGNNSNSGGTATAATTNVRGSVSFSPPSRGPSYGEAGHPSHQPFTRARNGTAGSSHSDTVRFHRDVFMKGIDKEAKPFMSAFTETQAFVQFVQDRVDRSPGDPEIMFFDEVIKAKINRSRFRLGKEETKFLDDPTYGVQGTVRAVPPLGEVQVFDNDTRRFPTGLDPAYL